LAKRPERIGNIIFGFIGQGWKVIIPGNFQRFWGEGIGLAKTKVLKGLVPLV